MGLRRSPVLSARSIGSEDGTRRDPLIASRLSGLSATRTAPYARDHDRAQAQAIKSGQRSRSRQGLTVRSLRSCAHLPGRQRERFAVDTYLILKKMPHGLRRDAPLPANLDALQPPRPQQPVKLSRPIRRGSRRPDGRSRVAWAGDHSPVVPSSSEGAFAGPHRARVGLDFPILGSSCLGTRLFTRGTKRRALRTSPTSLTSGTWNRA